jgi:superfamily II DNA/RNA helicase
MFDAVTASLLRSAPGVPGLDPNNIPSLLTQHYASLVSARLRGELRPEAGVGGEWSLDRIADTYEVIAAVVRDPELRRAAAFVAGTAQQILARRATEFEGTASEFPAIDRDRLDPALAAPVLFLAAEQYADASEAASIVRPRREGQTVEATILADNIADLARGRLGAIVERARRRRIADTSTTLHERALAALLDTLIVGIEILSAQFLATEAPQGSVARYDSPQQAFKRVRDLSSRIERDVPDQFGGDVVAAYAGPHHLASLLLAAWDGLQDAALTSIPPPHGADPTLWSRWLSHRAQKFPFVWPNHRQAVAKEFHQTGNSAVVVLPTGAGKTTISSLKIAGTLARRKRVVFLVPTHALVDQLTEELQEVFPEDLLGSLVSSDFDLLFQTGAQLQEIEVMTPERCLAMLSFAPEAFADVGLLVFDECHLLSPQSGKIRRAVDGMLCVLGFNHVAPEADMLFLSAMLRNGDEFSKWIRELTSRTCVCVDLLWKPSRQARGVVIYRSEELKTVRADALAVQRSLDKKAKKPAKDLRTAASEKLRATPWAIWGLKHNWLDRTKKTAHIITSKLREQPVELAGTLKYGPLRLTPNANTVAASLAATAARNGLKSIVFVNTKHDAVSTAKQVATELAESVVPTEAEQVRWDALQAELGGLQHSVLSGPSVAVPHNSAMLRLERDLAERMFRRQNGAKVIVATPTLAQGLNLPAHLAILAGDKRADSEGRETLEAHEILNAAARAGRAGHLANGVVLLIPEPVMEIANDKPLSGDLVGKLASVLPEDDRCVVIQDPLETVLDRLMEGNLADVEVRYLINRMAALREIEGGEEPTFVFNVRKSLGAYVARSKGAEAAFEQKVQNLKQAIDGDAEPSADSSLAMLAAQSGLSIHLLSRLETKIRDEIGDLPISVEDWLVWTINWLSDDDEALVSLLHDVQPGLLGACGRRKADELTGDVLREIQPGLLAWLRGAPLRDIEIALGGSPDATSDTKRTCPRARALVASVIPRGFAFVLGLVSHVIERVDPYDQQQDISSDLVGVLGAAMRKGFDSPEKLHFANDNPQILSRVQAHREWTDQLPF